MRLTEFLQLVKVLRMLYGIQVATKFFEKNKDLFPDLKDLTIANLNK